jgi:hypothetical protein
VSGVSQQPPALKLPTASDSMDNCWPSVVSGVSKRPPTEFVANLGTAFTSTAIGQIVNRTGHNTQFIITIADGNLRVLDFFGNEKTVNFPKGKDYLVASDPASSFRFVNIQDTTFILNTTVPVTFNNYGELTTAVYQPDGQVYTTGDLPDPNSIGLGIVYYVTSTDTYYQNTIHAATSDAFAWQSVGSLLNSAPSGATIVTSLPSATSAGVVVYYRTSYTVTKWVYYNGTLIPVSSTAYHYQKYQSYQTAYASSSYNYWASVSVSSIVSGINAGRRDPTKMGTVFVTNSVANVNYNVYINGTLKATYLTPKGVDASSSVPGTADIATQLKSDLVSNGYTVEQNGSTLTITNMTSTDTIQGTSSGGDKLVKCWRNKVATFGDLPPNSPVGRILKISGDLQNAQDDYYVVMSADNTWQETYGWNGGAGVDPTTMPWVLLHNADDTFTFITHVWRDRGCGDAISGHVPSFAGDGINDMFLFAGRLGFINDTNIVLSETFRYENFFRTTLASIQDSDPVDFTVATRNDDTLRHVIPFNKDLLIMADKSQYRFQYGQSLGPKSVQVVFTTAFNVSASVRPANMGNSVYFVDDASTYRFGKAFEYFPRPNQQGDDADEVTEPVPNYIPAGIKFLAGSPRMEMLTIGTSGDPGSLYCYKFFWAGDKKIQNAWHRWTFTDSDKVYWGGYVDNYLYLLLKRGTNVYLEKVRCDEEAVLSGNTKAMLDKQVFYKVGSSGSTVVYSGGFTTITLPYTYTTTPQVVGNNGTEIGINIPVTVVDSTHIKLTGDFTAYDLTVGIPYTMSFTLSSPYVRKATQTGQIAVLDGRLAVRYLNLVYSQTTYFKATLARKGYPTQYIDKFTTFSANQMDNVNISLGVTPVVDGKLRIPILAHNIDFTLTISNDSPFNCILQSGEWWATYHPRTKQFG